MKKNLIVFCLALFVTGFASAQIGPGRVVYVSVKTIDLKSSTGMFAGTVATLNYGDEVTVKQVNGKYLEVTASGSSSTGWAASEKFSTKKIVTGSQTVTSAKEIALAGKGFDQEIENTYSAQKQIDFENVDKVEAITADETELMLFIEKGNLSSGK